MARLGEGGGRRGRGFLPDAQRDPFVPDERVDEELRRPVQGLVRPVLRAERIRALDAAPKPGVATGAVLDRKSTRLNSSHGYISYAVFCLKKKKKNMKLT